jgi:hypothetical protein
VNRIFLPLAMRRVNRREANSSTLIPAKHFEQPLNKKRTLFILCLNKTPVRIAYNATIWDLIAFVVAFMRNKPPGSCILRIEESAMKIGVSPYVRSLQVTYYNRIIVTYKYQKSIFHHLLELPKPLRIKTGKNETILCRVDSRKSFLLIQNVYNFMPKLYSFITEFTSNKNYIGTLYSHHSFNIFRTWTQWQRDIKWIEEQKVYYISKQATNCDHQEDQFRRMKSVGYYYDPVSFIMQKEPEGLATEVLSAW